MENMHGMKKNDFQVKVDAKTGQKYVAKITDEMTKNHRETDKENFYGVMPESPGSQFCPVMSFENYIRRLHPLNERLWQKPHDSFAENSSLWYCNSAVGEKTLSSFMTQLSKKCGLSQIYTNHSIRATGATILSKNMYGAAQIMAVTGHKSVQSLSTYQRVDTKEKIKMGQTISQNISPLSAQLALPSTERLAITAPPTRQEDSLRVLQNLPPGTVVQNLEIYLKLKLAKMNRQPWTIYRVLTWMSYCVIFQEVCRPIHATTHIPTAQHLLVHRYFMEM